MNKPGIYMIFNLLTDKYYIGSAKDLAKRWLMHQYSLYRGDHFNPHLQNAWNKDGAAAFEFRVVEIVEDISLLVWREQHWLDNNLAYEREFGYNIRIKAESLLGVKHGPRKQPISEETRRRMSEARKGRIPTENQRKAVSEANKKRVGITYNVNKEHVMRKCKCEDCGEYRRELKRKYRAKMKTENPELLKANDKKWRGSKEREFIMIETA